MKRNRSFTLIEVIFALGLLVVVATLCAGILQSVQKLWIGIQNTSSELESLQNIDRIADYCLRNMVPFQWRDENNADRQIFRGTSQSLLFAHLHRSVGKDASGIRFIELKLENKQLTARYRRTPILHWLGEPVDDSLTEKEIIAENIESLEFEYAELDNDEILWFQDWPEEEKQHLPLAILMKIRFTNGSEEHWLRRTAGSSFDSTFGEKKQTVQSKLSSKRG